MIMTLDTQPLWNRRAEGPPMFMVPSAQVNAVKALSKPATK
jgi:hypothetical protein